MVMKILDIANEKTIACFASAVTLLAALVLLWGLSRAATIPFKLELEAERPFGLQVFFDESERGMFNEDHSRTFKVSAGKTVIDGELPTEKVTSLRLDLGSTPGRVVLGGGRIGELALPGWKSWNYNGDIESHRIVPNESGDVCELVSQKNDPFLVVRLPQTCFGRVSYQLPGAPYLVVLLLAFLGILCVIWNLDGCILSCLDRKRFLGLDGLEWLFLLACFVFYALWCVDPPLGYGPDENMRFRVTRFFFDHDRLPINEETIEPYWGFSYAHLPTLLCNALGCFFMRVAAVFTQDEKSLLIAARGVSVLSGVGVVYWVMRASRYLFHSSARWLFIVLIGALPQLAFVASYVNNDSLALLGTSMIFFVWVAALHDGWSARLTILLSIGMSVCAASYYNSYSWPLLSAMVCPFAYLAHRKRDFGGMLRTGFCVAALTLALVGYFFVRHLYLYGDLLGFETVRRFATQYAQGMPGGVHQTMYSTGVSMWQMLFERQWIGITCGSFVGVFGPMSVWMPRWCYWAFLALFCIGTLGWAFYGTELIVHRRSLRPKQIVLGGAMLSIVFITIGLSLIYSYTSDFQPQGRYCFPALIPMMFLVAKGLERFYDLASVRCGRFQTVLLNATLVTVAVRGYSTMCASLSLAI